MSAGPYDHVKPWNAYRATLSLQDSDGTHRWTKLYVTPDMKTAAAWIAGTSRPSDRLEKLEYLGPAHVWHE